MARIATCPGSQSDLLKWDQGQDGEFIMEWKEGRVESF